MFSHYELELIQEMCEEGMEAHRSALKIFDLDDPREARDYVNVERQIDVLTELSVKCEDYQLEFASVDADHMIHLLGVCESFMTRELARCTSGDIGAEEYAAVTYQIGYMCGRAELGILSESDVRVIEDWEELLSI